MNFTPVFVVTLQDVIGLSLLGLILLVFLTFWFIEWVKQSLCKHDQGVNETMACHAICRKCRKDLGFIGSYKERYGIK